MRVFSLSGEDAVFVVNRDTPSEKAARGAIDDAKTFDSKSGCRVAVKTSDPSQCPRFYCIPRSPGLFDKAIWRFATARDAGKTS